MSINLKIHPIIDTLEFIIVLINPPQDGFIHLTQDPQFLIGVANNFYLAKDPWEWICLRIDPAALQAPVSIPPSNPTGMAGGGPTCSC